MSSGEDPPVWRDPLLQRLEPTATGSGAFVEQPPPRANPMTVEGEIAAFGEMARGAASQPGWAGRLARVFISLALLGLFGGLVFQMVSLFRYARQGTPHEVSPPLADFACGWRDLLQIHRFSTGQVVLADQ